MALSNILSKPLILFTFALMVSGCFILHSAPIELVKNGNFQEKLSYWYLGALGYYCSHSFTPNSAGNNLHIEIEREAVNFWDVQLIQDIHKSIKSGDNVLLEFMIYNPDFSVMPIIQKNSQDYRKYASSIIPKSDFEQRVKILFKGSLGDLDSGGFAFGFFLGSLPGKCVISDISLTNFGEKTIDSVFKNAVVYDPVFGSQSNNDNWKPLALKRIETFRKSPLKIVCKYGDEPMVGTIVSVRQISHDFIFGTAVNAELFADELANKQYLDIVKRLFNNITIENHLKWIYKDKSQPYVDFALEWSERNKITVKGHALFWPSYNYSPPWLSNLSNGEQYDTILSHVREYSQKFRGRLSDWDVLNEVITFSEIWRKLGFSLLIDCFQTAKLADNHAKMHYNGNTFFQHNHPGQTHEFDLIRKLIVSGAPIEAIGIQGHFDFPYIDSPESVLKNLDEYAKFGLPIYISEFDIEHFIDDSLYAKFYEDILIAFFSHQAVYGITQWGFWEGSHHSPRRALYKMDFTPTSIGKVFENLVLNEWRTTAELIANSEGFAETRGFNGVYEITAKNGDTKITKRVSVSPNHKDTIVFDFRLSGIETVNSRYEISAYPNPFNEFLTIKYQFEELLPSNIMIFDAMGNTVRSHYFAHPDFSGKFLWDGRNAQGLILPNGAYFIAFASNNKLIGKASVILYR